MNFLRKIAGESFHKSVQLFREYVGEKAWILVLSVVVGVVAGFAAVILRRFTELCRLLAGMAAGEGSAAFWIAPAVPLLGILLCVIIVKIFFRKGPYDKSLAGVISAASNGSGDIPPRQCFAHMITSGIAVGAGGSAGLEAPIALTCSAIGSNFARFLRTGSETRTLLLACCGGAGISAMFNSPVTGALFACEILLPAFSIPALIPLLMASAGGAVVSQLFRDSPPFLELTSGWNTMNLPWYVLLGILAGLVSAYTIRLSIRMNALFDRVRNVWVKALCGGALLYLMFLLFPSLKGEGYGFIVCLVHGDDSMVVSGSPFSGFLGTGWPFFAACLLLILLKGFASATTIESGGDGGIFAPSMFIGAFTGFCVARGFNLAAAATGCGYQLSEVNFLAVGMGGVLAGVMHAPMTGMFLIAEMTGGYKLFIPLMITVALACYISKRVARYNVYKSMIAVRGGAPEPNQTAVLMQKASIRELVEHDFIAVKATDTLRRLLKVVMESRRNIYPVLDDSGKILGTVTLDSIRRVLWDSNLYDVVLVYDVMTPAGPAIDCGDSIASATRMFENLGVWNLPVVEGGKFRGFISKAGVFDKYREMLRNKPELF